MIDDQFIQERKVVLAKQIEAIVADLNRVRASDVPQFPERYFREVCLPYFAGDEERKYPAVDAAFWVARVAGSPFQEVAIISDTTREVLFVVPPLMDRNALNITSQGDGPPIDHVVKSAQQMRLMSPRLGEQHLKAELTKKALLMKVPGTVVSNLVAWNQIFERYGRPPIMEVELPTQTPSPASAAVSSQQDLLGDMEPL